jgi:hypothetical protein
MADRQASALQTKNPTRRVMEKWGWNDGWFSEAGLLAATEDQGESTEAEQGGGGGLWDGFGIKTDVVP